MASTESSQESGGSTLTGTWQLVRFIVRRDRVRLGVWTVSVAGFYAYFTFALDTLFADPVAQQGRAAVMETPAGIIMGGPGYGMDDYTTGVAMANEGITWVVLALAIMSILHVVRHTRAEEESGRAELLRAATVGRHAPAVASLITLGVVNAVIAVVSALTMVAIGDLPLVDSFAMTVGSALSAVVFGAVALVLCQVTAHARAATGMSLAVFAVAFVVRAAGDMREVGGSALSWLSPIAWAQQMRAFVDLRWWPLLISVTAIALLLWLASALASHRDFDAGLLPARKGRADARSSLRSPISLAWLQQRAPLGWSCLGLGLMWFASGTMLPDIDDMVGGLVQDNPAVAAIFGDNPDQFTLGFLGVLMLYGAAACAAYAIVMGHAVKGEESAGRAEVMLALPVARTCWLAAQLVVAGLGAAALLAVSVYAVWLGTVAVDGGGPGAGEYTAVFVGYLPAVLVYLALTAALYGWMPRAAGVGWALLAYSFVIGMFGGLFEDLPEAASWISPFFWVSAAFTEELSWPAFVGLTTTAGVLFLLALVGLRRRDIGTA
ncbi:ABC-2 type transport system permease protein [Cellulomonas humilata]|uniref:ABC-2 type transport system permease protein n=1 Tax=Cellulomonas humilata TaxID=144055 RepID=A0ABU0EH71_9CELL|nr:ABC-2 type transport system permease protein [Cellulomonas humilata]